MYQQNAVSLQPNLDFMGNVLEQLGNVPVSTTVLRSIMPNRNSFAHYISRKEASGELIRLKKGLYIVSPSVSGKTPNNMLVANSLYGPSYVSFQTALSYYSLIDDVPQRTMSASFRLHKQFVTPIGLFEYISLPPSYYPIGISRETIDNNAFMIASPEKALCDVILKMPKLLLRSQKDALTFLEDDLRFDTNRLSSLNVSILQQCAEYGYKSNSIQQLIKLITA